MAVPTTMVLTPQATVTQAMGENTGTGSEFYQKVTGGSNGGVFIIYENVPNALAQSLLQSRDPDTVIAAQLAAYPRRVVAI